MREVLRHAGACPAQDQPGAIELTREVFATLRRHRLGTHATALAFRALVSLVPLALLGVGLLGAIGQESAWDNTVSATLHRHLLPSVAHAADDTAHRILASNGAGLLVFAPVLVVWNTLLAIREVEHTLDEIHEQEGKPRPFLRTLATGLALAVAVDVLLVGALLVVVLPPRVVDHGPGHDALQAARWLVGAALLWVAVTLLVRYAPAQRPETRWASAGSAFVVAAWLGSSVLFGLWSAYVANYKTATGTLTAFLVLTAYMLVLAFVFVFGAQLDETLRRRTD